MLPGDAAPSKRHAFPADVRCRRWCQMMPRVSEGAAGTNLSQARVDKEAKLESALSSSYNSPLRKRSPFHHTESSTCSRGRTLPLCGRLPAQICTDLRLDVSVRRDTRRTGDDSVDQDQSDRVRCDSQGDAQEFVFEVTKGRGGGFDMCLLFAPRPAQGAVEQSARGISPLAEEGDKGLTRQYGSESDVP